MTANIHGDEFEDLTVMLYEDFVAEAMVDGALVGMAHVSVLTYVYAVPDSRDSSPLDKV